MSDCPDPSNARAALTVAGFPHAEPVFLAAGATCQVCRAGPVVVRLQGARPGQAMRPHVDALLRALLASMGLPVARPLAQGTLPDGTAYAVDTYLEGTPPDASGLSPSACRELGRLLAMLHLLPCTNYGLLIDDERRLMGCAPGPVEGLLSRLHDPWPFGPTPLEDHPLVVAAPDLAPALHAWEAPLRAAVEGRTVAVCHTDLHAGQLRLHGGHLVGLLDFGDAAIGPPAWDLASFAYFHGWNRLADVLDGYGRHDEALIQQTHLFGLLLAFHRASRAVELDHPARIPEAVRFARETLEQLAE